MIAVPKGQARIVARIEKAFVAYSEDNVNHVSFTQLKDWLNNNTREGISSPRLAAYLKRTPQFVKVQTYRKVGTNSTEAFWSLDILMKMELIWKAGSQLEMTTVSPKSSIPVFNNTL